MPAALPGWARSRRRGPGRGERPERMGAALACYHGRAIRPGLRLGKHIHILGICGSFMGGLALLARELGFRVSGCDANVYPPMSAQLRAAGIEPLEGYRPRHLRPAPDLVLVGNSLSRGNPALESLLNRGLPYTSGPQWLADTVLPGRRVLAVAGTHGKTTTSALLAWLLERAGERPGFLIGGVPANFGVSARLGGSRWFVVEADEYDTAFFDKRSKFVHYRPRTLCLTNLEYDHADIFPDLAAIQTQFHHLLRTVPGAGRVIHRAGDAALAEVLEMGCWSRRSSFAVAADAHWRALPEAADGSRFAIRHAGESRAVAWPHCGRHNMENALAAAAAAHEAGVPLAAAAEALGGFAGVRRRLELLDEIGGIRVYDDFAHHPTAIAATLRGLRAKVGSAPIRVLLEPRSNTMRMGGHRAELAAALADADEALWFRPAGLDWDLEALVRDCACRASLHREVAELAAEAAARSRAGDHVLIMSNGGFGGIQRQLLNALRGRQRGRQGATG